LCRVVIVEIFLENENGVENQRDKLRDKKGKVKSVEIKKKKQGKKRSKIKIPSWNISGEGVLCGNKIEQLDLQR